MIGGVLLPKKKKIKLKNTFNIAKNNCFISTFPKDSFFKFQEQVL